MYFAYIRTQKFLSHSPLPKEMVQQNQEVKEVNQEDNGSRKEGILYRRKSQNDSKEEIHDKHWDQRANCPNGNRKRERACTEVPGA